MFVTDISISCGWHSFLEEPNIDRRCSTLLHLKHSLHLRVRFVNILRGYGHYIMYVQNIIDIVYEAL